MSLPSAPDDGTDLSGRLLGDYQVIRWLGRGGMADVYLAQQQSLRRHVALKVLKPELADDEQYVRRFKNEAQAAAALVHANIVQIHEVGCIDRLQFIAQEYVRGQNLKELLDREGSLDTQKTVTILRQITAALCKAAEHGIVHRDIKPENILLSTDGTVKVADFGLARKNEANEGTQLTQIGVTMGTPLYMSPEQVEGKQLDGRTDIYSLGITAYQMLAGKTPFDGDTPLSIALQHVKEAPASLATERNDVPEELLQLIHRLLKKEPDDRCRDATQVLDELDRLPIAGGRRVDTQALADSVISSKPSFEPQLNETRTLAAVLNTKPSWASRLKGWLPVAAAGLLGCALAVPLRGGNPLAGVSESTVPLKSSVESQFFYAAFAENAESEDAWKAVIDFKPIDGLDTTETERLAMLRAKQQLGRWYITNGRARDAIPLLKELSQLDDMDNELRVAGAAWLAVAYQRLGDNQMAADVFMQAISDAELLNRSSPIWYELDHIQTELRAAPRSTKRSKTLDQNQ